jgi:hypothetical protein
VRNANDFCEKNRKGREYSGELDIDGSKILKCILKKQGVNVWTGFNQFRILPHGGLL